MDLLPGELVIPGELAVESYRGAPGDSLGAGVALGNGRLLAGAPGAGEVRLLGEGAVSAGAEGLGRWVWWHGDAPVAARADDGVYSVDADEAQALWRTPGAVSFAAGWMDDGFRVAAASGRGVALWDGEGLAVGSVTIEGVQRVAVGEERVLMLSCDVGCRALAWVPGTDELTVLGDAGDGGAVIEVDGLAWWGDPQLERDDGPGEVCAEDGRCLQGLAGDHLGRSLCAGYAAGVFNTWLVPARLRLVPLEGGAVLAVDSASPSRPPSLHREGDLLVLGLPTDGVHERGEGRVLLLSTLEADDLL